MYEVVTRYREHVARSAPIIPITSTSSIAVSSVAAAKVFYFQGSPRFPVTPVCLFSSNFVGFRRISARMSTGVLEGYSNRNDIDQMVSLFPEQERRSHADKLLYRFKESH